MILLLFGIAVHLAFVACGLAVLMFAIMAGQTGWALLLGGAMALYVGISTYLVLAERRDERVSR